MLKTNITFAGNVDPKLFVKGQAVSTGWPTIDKFLGGGLHPGTITIVSGQITQQVLYHLREHFEKTAFKEQLHLVTEDDLKTWDFTELGLLIVEPTSHGRLVSSKLETIADKIPDNRKIALGMQNLRRRLISKEGVAVIIDSGKKSARLLANNVLEVTYDFYNSEFEIKLTKSMLGPNGPTIIAKQIAGTNFLKETSSVYPNF